MKQLVKRLNGNGDEAFLHLKSVFLRLSDAKIEEGTENFVFFV